MRLCRVVGPAGATYALVKEDRLVAIEGDPFGEFAEVGELGPAGSASWLAPVMPSVFFAAGLNYYAHIEAAKRKGNTKAVVPTRPDIGHRANNALVGHGAEIVRPADFDGRLEYEGELVAIIGRSLKKVGRQEAEDAIFGWTLGNDVSAREWQHGDRTMWRGKNSDTFKPMGPWIDTQVEPLDKDLTVRINGELSSSFAVGAMIFDAIDFIVEITRYVTMQPGDVIWLGTDATHGMQVGDLVEVSLPGLGSLQNKVVAES